VLKLEIAVYIFFILIWPRTTIKKKPILKSFVIAPHYEKVSQVGKVFPRLIKMILFKAKLA
jgi:hypothetical protein